MVQKVKRPKYSYEMLKKPPPDKAITGLVSRRLLRWKKYFGIGKQHVFEIKIHVCKSWRPRHGRSGFTMRGSGFQAINGNHKNPVVPGVERAATRDDAQKRRLAGAL